jgi:hypothetical protein
VEAVEQAVRMSLLPAGRCDNPWVSREAMSEDLVFSDPVRLRVDLIVRLRQAFAGHRVRDRAALLPGSERVAAVSGQPGRVVLSFSWRNLRSDEVQTQEVEVGP